MATGFQIVFDVDRAGATAVTAELMHRLEAQELVDFLRQKIEPYVKLRIEGRFASEGDDVTGAWDPLKVATQLIRASHGFPPDHPINVRTSRMKDFLLLSPADIKVQGPEVQLTHPGPTGDRSLQEKIQTAQSGASSPNTRPRPVLGLNENDLLFITSELAAYLVDGII